jgi:hypothetical protein
LIRKFSKYALSSLNYCGVRTLKQGEEAAAHAALRGWRRMDGGEFF